MRSAIVSAMALALVCFLTAACGGGGGDGVGGGGGTPSEPEPSSEFFSSIFDESGLGPIVGTDTPFYLGQGGFIAEFRGDLLEPTNPDLTVPPSTRAWGVEGAGVAVIRFSSPASLVTVRARWAGLTVGDPTQDGVLRAFSPTGELLSEQSLRAAFPSLYTLTGPIDRIEVVNTLTDAVALIGEISAWSGEITTIFAGKQANTDLDDLVGKGIVSFTLGQGTFEADFTGQVVDFIPPDDLGPPNPNAFAVVGNDVSTMVFDDPALWVSVLARGSGSDVGLPDATARLRALDENGNLITSVDLPNDDYAAFFFPGPVAAFDLVNSTDGAVGAIGLLAAHGSQIRTRFEGPDFDAIVGVPSSFGLISGQIDALFTGIVLRELGLSQPPSLNAWGIRNSGTSTIFFRTPVRGMTLLIRGSDSDVGLNRADAVITARGPQNQFVLQPTAVRTDLGFYQLVITGPVSTIELTNNQAGSVAVIAEITIVSTDDS